MPAPALPTAAPSPSALDARRDYCRHQARQLRHQLRQQATQWVIAHRWLEALPGLLARAEPPARRWLLNRQADAVSALDADAAARYHLLRVRAEALEAEAAALDALLPT